MGKSQAAQSGIVRTGRRILCTTSLYCASFMKLSSGEKPLRTHSSSWATLLFLRPSTFHSKHTCAGRLLGLKQSTSWASAMRTQRVHMT